MTTTTAAEARARVIGYARTSIDRVLDDSEARSKIADRIHDGGYRLDNLWGLTDDFTKIGERDVLRQYGFSSGPAEADDDFIAQLTGCRDRIMENLLVYGTFDGNSTNVLSRAFEGVARESARRVLRRIESLLASIDEEG